MATVTEAYCISEGSGKETNHYVVSLKESGIRYKPGDSLAFYPSNNYELVKETIRKIGAKKKDTIKGKDGEETTLADALHYKFTIHRAGKKFLNTVAKKMGKGKDKEDLEKILDGYKKVKNYKHPDFTKKELNNQIEVYKEVSKGNNNFRIIYDKVKWNWIDTPELPFS